MKILKYKNWSENKFTVPVNQRQDFNKRELTVHNESISRTLFFKIVPLTVEALVTVW
jgi:hypothetical protein